MNLFRRQVLVLDCLHVPRAAWPGCSARMGRLSLLACFLILMGLAAEAQQYRKGRKSRRNREQQEQRQNPQPRPQPRQQEEAPPETPPQPVIREVYIVVQDETRLTPVSGVQLDIRIRPEGRQLKGQTGSDGRYRLELREDQTAEVVAFQRNYQRDTFNIGSQPQVQQFYLEPELEIAGLNTQQVEPLVTSPGLQNVDMIDFDQVKIVSATKTEQSLSEAPAIISVITAQQIRDRGYRTVAEALQSLPGIDMIYDMAKHNLGIRGVNSGLRGASNPIKLLIDNQPVSFRSSNENWLGEELIPIQAIERIEVIRGPSSAVYGANAFLGAINIITRSGENLNGGMASGEIGMVEENPAFGGTAMAGAQVGKLEFLGAFTAKRYDRSGLQPRDTPDAIVKRYDDPEDVSDNDLYQPLSAFIRANFTPAKAHRIKVDFNLQQLDTYAEFQDWAVLAHENRIALQNFYVRAGYTVDILENLTANVSGTYANGGPLERERIINPEVRLLRENSWMERSYGFVSYDLVGDLLYSIKDGVATITAGYDRTEDQQILQTFYIVDAEGQREENPYNGQQNLGEETFINQGVYAQGIVYPFQFFNTGNSLQTLGVTLGIRGDFHNIYGDVTNSRVSLVYKPVDRMYIKALYGTSFRAPAASQLFSNYIRPGEVRGNPELQPESATTFEASVGAKISRYFNVSVNGYYNQITDKIFFIRPPGAPNVIPDNIAEINSVGGELEIQGNYENLFGYINYSYQNSTIPNDDPDDEDANTAVYADHMVKFGLNYRIPKFFLNINLEGRYIGQRLSSNQNRDANDPVNREPYALDGYFVLDMALSTTGLEFFRDRETIFDLRAQNLTNSEYFYPGFRNFDIPALGFRLSFRVTQYF